MKNSEDYKAETALAKRLYSDETARPAKPSPSSMDTPEIIQRKKLMVWLWAKMSLTFGGGWEGTYGGVRDPGIKEWMDSLGIFTDDEIRGGRELALDWDGKYVPTLPQFRSLCFASRKTPNFTEKREAEEKITGQPQSMIEHLSRHATSHIAQRELARMRGIIAGCEAETKQESYDLLHLSIRWGAL